MVVEHSVGASINNTWNPSLAVHSRHVPKKPLWWWGRWSHWIFLMISLYILLICCFFSTSERGKNLICKGLRQAGLIIPKRNFKTRACLWIPDSNFHLGVSVLGNILDYHIRLTYWITKYKIFFWSGMLRIHSVQPILWYAEKVIQSNPVSYVDIWFIYMWYNPLGGGVTCKYLVYWDLKLIWCRIQDLLSIHSSQRGSW